MGAGGEGRSARDVPHATSRAGHIPCVICTGLIGLDQYQSACCWTDPNGVSCAAHGACLVWVGERDLGLA
jgi:hypothetical protein